MEEGGWLPIETAPEDTTPRRLKGTYPFKGEEREVIGFYESGGYTWGWVDERLSPFWPTHWAPLHHPEASAAG